MTELALTWLPRLNATLNGTAGLFLLAGFVAIRRKQVRIHRTCMLSAFSISVLFLASYVTYHTLRQAATGVGHVRYQGPAWSRSLYFSVLFSHLVLATLLLPLVIVTMSRALKGRFDRHRRIARWTWPIWIYVSTTGVAVYAMLYHL